MQARLGRLMCVASAVAALSGALPAAAQSTVEERLRKLEEKTETKGGLKAYWKEGIRMDSADGDFKLKLGGRVEWDWGLSRARRGPGGGAGSRQERDRVPPRAPLRRGPDLTSASCLFKAQYDFAGGEAVGLQGRLRRAQQHWSWKALSPRKRWARTAPALGHPVTPRPRAPSGGTR